ncbi:hypothetical protein CG723_25860 [Streptomyces sp. CB01635]|uniref:hypothetical protein n=1 Tax=unclassified Streptomyces TaxID=2593676 RepID=UPI000C2809E3|nr:MULTISPECIES: hypothetical protein [unclassified Streptomyces]PJN08914.1 hypothetical protein CG723_25860 [Streptomyces sp. CB01635]WSE05134.1 hypothetical protein OG574_18280 [Streptomyces sp. NBC_01445]
MSTTRRACLLARGTFVAAVLGGALLVPTAAFAHAQPDRAAAPAPASEPGHGTPDSNPLFLAAGGGMAAAGAGGLAFSMYRRGRTDG